MTCSTTRIRRIYATVTLAVFLIGIAVPGGLLIWQATAPSMVLRAGPAGTLITTTTQHSILVGNTFTRIATSTGSVVVHGVFSGLKGSPLAIEQFNKFTGLRLCLGNNRDDCVRLAGVWAGPLSPTPAARTAIDFQRYGLTASNLTAWLVIGAVCLALAAVIGVIVLACENDESRTDADASQ